MWDHIHNDDEHDDHEKSLALWIVAALNLFLSMAEIVIGAAFSIPLLVVDGTHNLGDAGTVLLGAIAEWLSHQQNSEFTFGVERVKDICAVLNTGAMAVVVIVALIDSFTSRSAPATLPMYILGAVSFILNAASARMLHRHHHHDSNVGVIHAHLIGDMAGAALIILAAILTNLTYFSGIQSIATTLLCGLIIGMTYRPFMNAVRLLMNAAPRELKVEAVQSIIEGVPGVISVHGLKVWLVEQGVWCVLAHVRLDGANDQDVLLNIITRLVNKGATKGLVTLMPFCDC